MTCEKFALQLLHDYEIKSRYERLLSALNSRIDHIKGVLLSLGAIPLDSTYESSGNCLSVLWPVGDGRYEIKKYHLEG